MNTNNLKRILEDQDFVKVVRSINDRLTAKVMSAATSPDDRETALHEYHGLQRVMKTLLAATSQPKE
jgi:hypothetical protein